MSLVNRTLTCFTLDLSYKNKSVLINRRKTTFEIFHQSWGFGIYRYLENETANPEMEHTSVIPVEKYLVTFYSEKCADARGVRDPQNRK